MSSVTVITAISILLAVLVCFAFISQSIKQKQEQKKRLLSALKSRSRTFKYMLSGFPPGFLSRDLTMLVQRSLAEVSEQLSKLEPGEPKHLQDFQLAAAALSEKSQQSGAHQPPILETHQQIKEVKACLEELYKFIVKLEEKNTLSSSQGAAHRAQIKQLVVLVTVDGYELHGRKAIQQDKTKLAIHYFDLTYGLLIKEGKAAGVEKRIQETKKQLSELKEKLAEIDPSAKLSKDEINEQAEVQAEWDKMSTGDDLWKKKNVYD